MLMKPPMVFAQTDGIVDHTCTRGPSVARMRDFFLLFFQKKISEIGQPHLHILLNINDLNLRITE